MPRREDRREDRGLDGLGERERATYEAVVGGVELARRLTDDPRRELFLAGVAYGAAAAVIDLREGLDGATWAMALAEAYEAERMDARGGGDE